MQYQRASVGQWYNSCERRKPTNTENHFYFKGTCESRRRRNTQNYWTLVPLKLQVKPTFEYFLEIPQEVKEGKAGKDWDGISDLRIKQIKAEVARDLCAFHDSVVTSTALWPSGFDLKGSKAVLSGQSAKLRQVPCDGKTPAVSVGRFFRELQGSLTKQGESSERQKDAQKHLLSSRKSFVWLKGCYGFQLHLIRCSDAVATQSKAGWEGGQKLLERTLGRDHWLEWHL